MSVARLFLSGIHADGHHGARPGEKETPQTLVVDLDIELEVDGDTIDGTVDYRGVTETVRAVVEGRSFDLIETMAAAIADEILAIDRVRRVTAVVHKPNAATRLGIDGVAAGATASRG